MLHLDLATSLAVQEVQWRLEELDTSETLVFVTSNGSAANFFVPTCKYMQENEKKCHITMELDLILSTPFKQQFLQSILKN